MVMFHQIEQRGVAVLNHLLALIFPDGGEGEVEVEDGVYRGHVGTFPVNV